MQRAAEKSAALFVSALLFFVPVVSSRNARVSCSLIRLSRRWLSCRNSLSRFASAALILGVVRIRAGWAAKGIIDVPVDVHTAICKFCQQLQNCRRHLPISGHNHGPFQVLPKLLVANFPTLKFL